MNVEYAQRVRRLARLRIRAEVARRRAERLQATRATGTASGSNGSAEPALIRPRRARHADQTQRATS